MTSIAQCVLLAGIVATMLYFPIVLALSLLFRLFGVPFAAFFSFGGALNLFAGLGVWWLLFFAGSLVYAACLIPWDIPSGDRREF